MIFGASAFAETPFAASAGSAPIVVTGQQATGSVGTVIVHIPVTSRLQVYLAQVRLAL